MHDARMATTTSTATRVAATAATRTASSSAADGSGPSGFSDRLRVWRWKYRQAWTAYLILTPILLYLLSRY